jgi:hypothetical protein
VADDEESEDAGGVHLIRLRLNGLNIHFDTVNPKQIELKAAKEMLAEYGTQIWQVDKLIMQRIVDFRLTGVEFRLYAASRACFSWDY